jgi:hypothetical protein
MARIKFTGFATDSKTGNRTRVEGETKSNNVSRHTAENAARNDLQTKGYRDIHIDDTTYTEH